MEVSILKLLGLENSKTVIPPQVAAFNERGPSKWVVVSILKLLGLENSKAVTPSLVGSFLMGNSGNTTIQEIKKNQVKAYKSEWLWNLLRYLV